MEAPSSGLSEVGGHHVVGIWAPSMVMANPANASLPGAAPRGALPWSQAQGQLSFLGISVVQALGQETPHDHRHYPQSQSRKLRPWEVEKPARGHPDGKWQSQGAKSPGSEPHTLPLSPQLPVTWQSWRGPQAWVGPPRMGPGQMCPDGCQGGRGRRWKTYQGMARLLESVDPKGESRQGES